MKIISIVLIGLMVTSSLIGQSSGRLTNYEMTKPMQIKGTVSSLVLPTSGPAFMILEVTGSAGKAEHWVIEGDAPSVLIRAGWRPRQGSPIGNGTSIEITVHPLKAGVEPTSVIPADAEGLRVAAKEAKVVYGTQIVLPDGKKVTFGGNPEP